MKKFFLLSVLISMVFISCKKDSNKAPCTLSSSSLVGNYKITSYLMTMNGQTIDVFSDTSFIPICQKDDIFTINANGTMTKSEGAISCDPPSTGGIGNWALNGTNFTLSTDSTSPAQSYTISDFSCTSFKLNNLADSSFSLAITMTRQ